MNDPHDYSAEPSMSQMELRKALREVIEIEVCNGRCVATASGQCESCADLDMRQSVHRMALPSVDEESYALAQHFLRDDDKLFQGPNLWSLAADIQQAVEDWFSARESREPGGSNG